MPSMKPNRTHIAAVGTMVALGALAAVAIGAGPGQQTKTVSVPRAQPVEVRTVVVHRTIRVVRHQKPKKHKRVAAPPAPAATTRPVQIAQAPAPTYQPVATKPAPASSTPLKTATSGSGSGEHKDDGGEREGGGDD
jgi:hypothetical protein